MFFWLSPFLYIAMEKKKEVINRSKNSPLVDLGAKLGVKVVKGLPPAPRTSLPKVSIALVTPHTDDLTPLPTTPHGANQKFQSASLVNSPLSGPSASHRGHTKVQSTGSGPSTLQSTVTNTQQASSQPSPRLGLVRAAMTGAVKTGTPIIPQPIQLGIDPPKSSSAPSNLIYLEYDLHAVVDVANQFIGLGLQVLSSSVSFLRFILFLLIRKLTLLGQLTVDDLNGINRLLKQLTQSTATYINTIKQNVSRLPQHSTALTNFARALRDVVNIVIADFKVVCTNVVEDTQNLTPAIEKCMQSIEQLSRVCYYNGAFLTHVLHVCYVILMRSR